MEIAPRPFEIMHNETTSGSHYIVYEAWLYY